MRDSCVLCGKIAEVSRISGKDEFSVVCDTCKNYDFDNLFKKSFLSLSENKRAMISAYARECFERGEEKPKFADPDNLRIIIDNYENKTLDEKIANLVIYLKKKSQQFGDSIPWDENKDYPITYSQGAYEFLEILKLATKKHELVSWPARGVGLKLTDEGWKKGEVLEKVTKMGFKEKRRLFLLKLWELTEGDLNEIRDIWDIGKELGFSNPEIRKIGQYLEGEGQIVFVTDQGEISISHEGAKEAENMKYQKRTPESMDAAVKRGEVDFRKVFVVHGRNEIARKALFDFLRTVGIEPIEWGEAIKMTKDGSPYPQGVLDKAFSVAGAIIVLITGDDIARLRKEYCKPDDREYEKKLTPQARANVIFEAGLAFGRCPDRTILVELEKEKIRPFSDVLGRLCVRLSNDVRGRYDLITRLKTAGCEICIEGRTDWIKTGDFDGAVVEYSSEMEREEEKYKEEKINLNDEQKCILLKIAGAKGEVDEDTLFKNYKYKFPMKLRIDFNLNIFELEKLALIRHSSSLGGLKNYVVKDKGFQLLRERK